MKKLLFLLIALSIQSFSFAQANKIILIEEEKYDESEEWLPSGKTTFQYNDNNDLVVKKGYRWDESDGTYHLQNNTYKSYNPNNNNIILEERIYGLDQGSMSYYQIHYQYQANDCLSSTTNIYTSGAYKSQDERIYTCDRLDTIYHYEWIQNYLKPRDKRVFSYDGNTKTMDYYIYSNDTWLLYGQSITTTDTILKTETILIDYSDFAEAEKWFYKNDDHDNPLLQKYYVQYLPSDSLTLASSHEYLNTYNSQNQLSQVVKIYNTYWQNSLNFTDTLKTEYQYYCDSLLKQATEWKNGSLNKRTHYYYQEDITCKQKDINCDKEVDIAISPNPTMDYIEISSPALESGAVSINIYNPIGQNLFSKIFDKRMNKYRINLSSFTDGIYMVTIQWDDHIVTKLISKE